MSASIQQKHWWGLVVLLRVPGCRRCWVLRRHLPVEEVAGDTHSWLARSVCPGATPATTSCHRVAPPIGCLPVTSRLKLTCRCGCVTLLGGFEVAGTWTRPVSLHGAMEVPPLAEPLPEQPHVTPADPAMLVLLRDVLAAAGLVGEKLALQAEDPEDREGTLLQVLAIARVEDGPTARRAFEVLLGRAVEGVPAAKRARGDYGTLESIRLGDALAAAGRGVAVRSPAVEVLRPLPGTRPRLGIRRHRQLGAVPENESRQRIEEAELVRWRGALLRMFHEAEVPAIAAAAECLNPEGAIEALVAGRARAKTLRTYVQTWGRMRRWLLVARGRPWPARASDYIDYLMALKDQPCRPSVPGAWLQACIWVERAAGLPESSRHASSEGVRRAVAFVSTAVADPSRPVRRAPRFYAAMIADLERLVVRTSESGYLRGVAWVRLVKVWASLRYDDLSWLAPAALRLGTRGLEATLRRTKTSGAGRRVRELPLLVSCASHLVEAD